MIEKTNQVKMFKASVVIGEQTLTANVKVDLSDNLLSIDSGSVTNATTTTSNPVKPLATFYLYEGGTLSISVTDKNDLTSTSELISDFINQLTPSK